MEDTDQKSYVDSKKEEKEFKIEFEKIGKIQTRIRGAEVGGDVICPTRG